MMFYSEPCIYDNLKFSDNLKWSASDNFNGCGVNNAMINFSMQPFWWRASNAPYRGWANHQFIGGYDYIFGNYAEDNKKSRYIIKIMSKIDFKYIIKSNK